jgi:hypothetical protein
MIAFFCFKPFHPLQIRRECQFDFSGQCAMAKRTAGRAENNATLPNLHRIKIEIRKNICRRMFAGKESCQRKSRGRLAQSRLLLCC